MKNKKGFTLIELLAVIALISIVMILVVPNVTKLFINGKKNAFKDEVLILYKNATTTYITRSNEGDTNKMFCNVNSTSKNLLDTQEQKELLYNIKVDNDGRVVELNISNETYGLSLKNSNGIKKKDITIEEITDKIEIKCE